MLIYNPILLDTPMASLKEMQDGTYSLDDVLKMNLLIQYKMEMTKRDN